MTVEPGFGGQEFCSEVLPKLRELREWVGETVDLVVDGGIDASHRAAMCGGPERGCWWPEARSSNTRARIIP